MRSLINISNRGIFFHLILPFENHRFIIDGLYSLVDPLYSRTESKKPVVKDVLKYKGFIGSVHYAAEDRVFYGKVEGVNDLISFEGSTVDELEEGFKYMVDEHIKD